MGFTCPVSVYSSIFGVVECDEFIELGGEDGGWLFDRSKEGIHL